MNEFTVITKNGSNKIFGSSSDKFPGISNGTLIKLDNSSELYTVIGKEREFLIKDFSSLDGRTLIINGDVIEKIQKNDFILITYKEYELLGLLDIPENGSGYAIGEELIVDNGTANVEISTGSPNPTVFTVIELNDRLGISKLSLKNSGSYISPPSDLSGLSGSRFGNGAKILTKYTEKDNRTVCERRVVSINIKDNQTYLHLDYSLPPNVKIGKISLDKYSLIINQSFNGISSSNVSYKIYRDFTPHVNIPLMVRGSISPELIFNKAMQKLDEKIRQLEERINK